MQILAIIFSDSIPPCKHLNLIFIAAAPYQLLRFPHYDICTFHLFQNIPFLERKATPQSAELDAYNKRVFVKIFPSKMK